MHTLWQATVAVTLALLGASVSFQFLTYRSLSEIKLELAREKKATPEFSRASVPEFANSSVELFKDFEATLQPGGWEGTTLGPCSNASAYIVKITPLEPASRDGASIEKCVVQPEFNGPGQYWIDVLRLRLPSNCAPLRVNVRIYKISARM